MEHMFDKVVGVTFGDCQKNIAAMKKGDRLRLVPEPENPYDKNAIRVESADGKKLGYVKRDGWLSKMIIEEKTDPHVEVSEVVGGCNNLNYGLVMKVVV